MRYGYTILYVEDVSRSIAFYEAAFGLTRRFVGPDGQYAEMETGGTALAFAANDFIRQSLPNYRVNNPSEPPAGIEIGLVTDDVPAALERAVNAGARLVLEPVTKPWGQVVSYVTDLDGFLVEICTPVG